MTRGNQIMNSSNIDPKNSISPALLRRGFLLITIALAGFALPQMAHGQDGGYRNGSTAEGGFALYTIITDSSATGRINTAVGLNALRDDSSGESNTACGAYALGLNQAGSDNTAI